MNQNSEEELLDEIAAELGITRTRWSNVRCTSCRKPLVIADTKEEFTCPRCGVKQPFPNL